jgi:hypothetical protein
MRRFLTEPGGRLTFGETLPTKQEEKPEEIHDKAAERE